MEHKVDSYKSNIINQVVVDDRAIVKSFLKTFHAGNDVSISRQVPLIDTS